MLIQDLLPGFKRYLLYERGLTAKYTEAVIHSVENLASYEPGKGLSHFKTHVISSFLHDMREKWLWSPKTFRNYRQHLLTFFNYAVENGHLKENPVRKIGKPRLPKNLPRCLSDEQIQALISHVHCCRWFSLLASFRNVAIVYMFLFTGIRLSELLNLKVRDIDYESAKCFIEKGKGKKDRYVPLHPKLIPVLKVYQRKREECLPPSEYFFTSIRSEKRLTQKNLYAVFEKLSQKCGFKVTPHQLRHSFARSSIENGLGLYLLKEILGHSSVSTTEIYLSVATQRLTNTFGQIDMF